MVEREIKVSSKLKIGYVGEDQDSSNYAEVLPQINGEKNPILHRYISMKANWKGRSMWSKTLWSKFDIKVLILNN